MGLTAIAAPLLLRRTVEHAARRAEVACPPQTAISVVADRLPLLVRTSPPLSRPSRRAEERLLPPSLGPLPAKKTARASQSPRIVYPHARQRRGRTCGIGRSPVVQAAACRLRPLTSARLLGRRGQRRPTWQRPRPRLVVGRLEAVVTRQRARPILVEGTARFAIGPRLRAAGANTRPFAGAPR